MTITANYLSITTIYYKTITTNNYVWWFYYYVLFRKVIRNNEIITTYYFPGQLGDEGGRKESSRLPGHYLEATDFNFIEAYEEQERKIGALQTMVYELKHARPWA